MTYEGGGEEVRQKVHDPRRKEESWELKTMDGPTLYLVLSYQHARSL